HGRLPYSNMVRVARGPKPRLSCERVVGQAIELLDAEGPDVLTIRWLAAEFDTGVGTVYWHVDGKEALLELARGEILGRAGSEWRAESWDGRLHEAGLELYDLMLAHFWAPG